MISKEAWARLPHGEIVVPDPSPWSEDMTGGKPLAYVEVDGKPVARLSITAARHEVGIGVISHLHLTLVAGDASLRSRPKIPREHA